MNTSELNAAQPENVQIENVQIRLLQAYIESSDVIQRAVRTMFEILKSSETDEQEKAMAMHTIADCLFPNFHKGLLDMDYDESEREAAEVDGEFASIVAELDAEEGDFAERLRHVMEAKNLTQRELAAAIGVGQPAISNMLQRKCRPQRQTVLRLAKALDISPGELWPAINDVTN